ncbi:MAG: DUF6714 family protein [Vicinamibacteria bacterium]
MRSVEWKYSDVKAGQSPADPASFAVHMTFLIRFHDLPPGEDHCAFFSLNVVSPKAMAALGLPADGKRGFIVHDTFSNARVVAETQRAIDVAFSTGDRQAALTDLDQRYIRTDVNFAGEFRDDLLPEATLAAMIDAAFAGVDRGAGRTLHEAVAVDDYLSEEECRAARAKDPERRWQDVSHEALLANPSFVTFLDPAGFRYYLPAIMRLSLDAKLISDTFTSAFANLLPIVAPRDVGKGIGEAFDVDESIAARGFSAQQVRAIYGFLCHMAVRGGEPVDEDTLPAMRRWRQRARESLDQ